MCTDNAQNSAVELCKTMRLFIGELQTIIKDAHCHLLYRSV